MFDAGAVAGSIKFDTSSWTAAKNKITQEAAALRTAFRNMAKGVGESMRKAVTDFGALKEKLAQHTATIKAHSMQVGFASAAIAGYFGLALKSAMESQEALNLVQVSFKGSTDEMLAWSKSVADSMGVGSNEIASMAGQLNLMINSMGLGSEASKTMSKELTKLTYDLASLRNLSIEEAFLKLKSGITGETEPLKALGITLLETQVKAFAAAHGIGALGRELTEQEKVVARFGLIMERTKEDQGDMARTWDSATNLTRAFGSQIKQLSLDIGALFIPAYSEAMKVVGGFVLGLRTFVSEHPALTAAMAGTAAAASVAVLALGAMVPVLAVLRSAYAVTAAAAGIAYTVMFSGPALIVAAIAGIGVALYSLRAVFLQNVGLIRTGWNMLQRDLVDAWNKTGGALVGGFDALRYAFTVAHVSIVNVAKTVANTVIGIWKSAAVGLRTLWDTWDPEAAFGAMKKAVLGTDYIGDVIGGLQVALSTYKPIIERGVAQTYEAVTLNLSEIGGAVTTQFGEDVDAFLDTLREKLPSVGKLIDDSMGAGRTAFEGYQKFDPKKLLEGAKEIVNAGAKAGEAAKAGGAAANDIANQADQTVANVKATAQDTSEILGNLGNEVSQLDQWSSGGSAMEALQQRWYEKKAERIAEIEDLSGKYQQLGSAIAQLGPKFQGVALAAQTASRVMSITASVAKGDWLSVATEGIMLVGDALGFLSDETEEVKKGMDRVMEEIGKSIEGWVDQMTDAIVEFVQTGKFEFKEFVNSVLEDITRLIVKYAIIEPLLGSMGIKMTPNALGNVYDQGNIIPFAKGGVIARPTVAPMALMGEAGPEAILPLKRLDDGRLGVSAEGGGGGARPMNLIVHDNATHAGPVEYSGVETTGPDGLPQLEVFVNNAVKKAVASGAMDGIMGRTYGLRRRGA